MYDAGEVAELGTAAVGLPDAAQSRRDRRPARPRRVRALVYTLDARGGSASSRFLRLVPDTPVVEQIAFEAATRSRPSR